MAKTKTREEKLFGAAVLKTSFRLRGQLEAPAFKGVFPGVLRDLGLTDEEVEQYIAAHKETVEKAARGAA
jgi:hypothetical protein